MANDELEEKEERKKTLIKNDGSSVRCGNHGEKKEGEKRRTNTE